MRGVSGVANRGNKKNPRRSGEVETRISLIGLVLVEWTAALLLASLAALLPARSGLLGLLARWLVLSALLLLTSLRRAALLVLLSALHFLFLLPVHAVLLSTVRKLGKTRRGSAYRALRARDGIPS
jgi:hypothetical protein